MPSAMDGSSPPTWRDCDEASLQLQAVLDSLIARADQAFQEYLKAMQVAAKVVLSVAETSCVLCREFSR